MTSNNPHAVDFVDNSAVGAAGRLIRHMNGAKPAQQLEGSAPSASHRLATGALAVEEFKIGDRTTCQFGNPGDTDWSAETHAYVPVIIVDKQRCEVTFRMYYLVTKVDDREYLGRASDARGASDRIRGETYCTNARTIGSKAQSWTGVTTFLGAASSLGFKLPIYDATMDAPKLSNVSLFDTALCVLTDHFEPLITGADEAPVRQLFERDFDEKEAIVRDVWNKS